MSSSATSVACLHEIFEGQVDRTPCSLALVHDDLSFTYGELDGRANQLAHHLASLGAKPGELVGICFDRSEKPIIAILAILKTGAAYVPIDPAYPGERITHIVEDARIGIIVTEARLESQLAQLFNGAIVAVDGRGEAITGRPTERIAPGAVSLATRDLCYVMYTSGTTGRPKGVMTEHGNVISFVAAFNRIIRLGPEDRVYQGFPYGFDGSVEEMWMAFSNGATLVVGRSDILRFGNDAARYLTEKGVTVFSTVPTFLSTIGEDLPKLRLLIVSGEQCPAELVARWATPTRRMLNVYGPTETTVNTTAEECRPGKPITIGKPLEGYETHILDKQMQPVSPGEEGELYIGGTGVSRGYLNLPEQTAKAFVESPFDRAGSSARLYRTGDLVRLDGNGDLVFLGRLDSQVKVRGFRIELSEIESVLRECPLIQAAAVKVFKRDGIEQLAAFVKVPPDAGGLNRNEVLDLLKSRLTEYMIPQYLDVLEDFPTLTSGKIDRNSLPEPRTPLTRTDRRHVPPGTELEATIAEIWKRVFRVDSVSIEDDFFLDLGGHSLLAAQAVSLMRNEHDIDVAIRDIYRHPTVAKLAQLVSKLAQRTAAETTAREESRKSHSSRSVFESLPKATRWCCLALQTLSLYGIYGLGTLPFIVVFLLYFGVRANQVTLLSAMWILVAFSVGLLPFMIVMSAAVKWIVIGRYRPGRYPLWSFYYFRWWLVSRFQMLSGAGFLGGTPLMSLYYRLMGAKVGRGCIIDTGACSIFDLVTIGDGTSIGSETQLSGCRVEDGVLVIGGVEIGSRCFIGIHSSLGVNTRMGDGCRLDDLSLLPDGETMQAGESRRGSPGQPAKVPVPDGSAFRKTRGQQLLFGLLHFLGIYAIEGILLMTAMPSIALLYYAYTINDYLMWAACLLAAIPLFEISFCTGLAAAKAVVLRRVKPGVYPVYSLFYLRKWIIDSLMNISRLTILPIYTTLYLPPWLRLLGARIGKRVELSIVTLIAPELLVTEEECFFADGSIVGGNRFHDGCVQFSENRVGRRSFIGNEALLPVNTHVGSQCLIGVLSTPPEPGTQTPDGSDWLGSPSFRLPHRQKVASFDDSVIYTPSRRLLTQRWTIDTLRIVIPSLIEIVTVISFVSLLYAAYTNLLLWAFLLVAPLIAIASVACAALCVVLVKNLLIGRFVPVIKPLWSMFVWLNEVINGAYESVAAPILSPLLGTPFFAAYLRMLGCKVGRSTYIGTTLFGEFDLVEIGDYAALDNGAIVQNHLFEDRVFKASHIKIGDECTVGAMAVVLYDTEMRTGSSLAPLSLLMKGEDLPPFTSWVGIPTGAREEIAREEAQRA